MNKTKTLHENRWSSPQQHMKPRLCTNNYLLVQLLYHLLMPETQETMFNFSHPKFIEHPQLLGLVPFPLIYIIIQ
jgi:hypothetical protein